jgi:hypothetical protein
MFQETKVRDGLYLLTGDVKPVALPESSCHTCGQTLTPNDLEHNRDRGVNTNWQFCSSCLDCTPRERAERQYQFHGYQQNQQVGSFCDTPQRF